MNIHICVYIKTYIHKNTYIYIYIVPLMILRLFITYCKIRVFEHYTYLCLPPGNGSSCFIAKMKQTAHRKHLKVCLTSNLKVFPLDR